ncbi:MAG: 16S rRNA (cytidine(1402)-2'-O)-methyltransferase [Gammaproteobacteria bacterium]|jgi:16S rRNA (cytidine1402-2'-O)-methyltransferase|nr:16S rRNA (cytidine(1402)-2'-O)-methyltransferase [Gammaproteobacteria bacterium]
MSEGSDKTGILWVVATPIGNLGDFSARAREVLGQVAVIAAEDTRVTGRLLEGLDVPARKVSLHEHNEARVIGGLIEQLAAGREVALVSDAGTPLISDPGYRLVSAAHDAGVPVHTVPGPCAATAALSVAGLPTDRFLFEGFLPARSAARRKRLGALAGRSETLVFYAPARDLPDIFDDLAAALGKERRATLARELTKLHETVRRDTLDALHDWVGNDPDQQRGEAVIVVEGNPAGAPEIDIEALAAELARELPPSRAAKVLARLSGMDRKEAWGVIEGVRR